VFTFALAAIVLVADQLTKVWALASLNPAAAQRNLLGDYLSLRLTTNSGAALSIGAGYTWVLTVIIVAVVVVIVRTIRRIRSRAWAVTLGLLLGGALGNLSDRLFRAPGFGRGHVVDFIGYWNWFTGNVADVAIVSAAVLLGLLTLLGIGLDGRRVPHGPEAPAEAGQAPVEAGDGGGVDDATADIRDDAANEGADDTLDDSADDGAARNVPADPSEPDS
jgi:signal peptidase II